MKKKTRKILPGLLIALLFSSTIAFAASPYAYSFSLWTGAEMYSSLVAKDTSRTSAKVQRQSPAAPETTITFTVVNSSGVTKSSTVKAYGVTTVYPSYSGYGVSIGDYVKLKALNYAPDNNGVATSAAGYWTP